MKKTTTILLATSIFCILIFSCAEKENANSVKNHATYQLIERITPGYSDQFIIEEVSSGEKDYYEIEGSNDKIVLRGNNPVSIASAFNHYLKYSCNAHLSWCGDQLNLPKKLPIPTTKTRKDIDQKYRVNFNYCTISYSAAWWDWDRWEREIDFMAMNGINMPLSVVGLEGVWYNTLTKHGFSDEEARSFLVGPAYFAWQWMPNIQSHLSPLPKNWIEKRNVLGKKIMDRELALGMKPIQQGFTGYVPVELIEKNPNSAILREGRWCNFPGTAQLDPLDPKFLEIGKTFYEEQEKLFGAHHYYAADPFHEGTPPQKGSEYLNKVGERIFEVMQQEDSLSTWVMQAWSIRKDIATVVPKNNLLILDLNNNKAASNDNFWGYDFIAGNLHNFGARINMHGDLKLVAANKYRKSKEKAPNTVGTGFFMEGIIQNPAYYDLAFEMGTRKDSIDISSWLNQYSERRYGASSENAKEAWQIFLNTVYKEGTDNVENSSIICARPAVDVKKSGPNAGFNIPYDTNELLKGLKLLLADQDKLQHSDPYNYDAVDITRQYLSNLGQNIHKKAAKAFKEKNKKDFKKYSNFFLNLLKDVDRLLSTRKEFSFEKWVTDARSWGTTDAEKNYYELNASMLVTLWGPEPLKDEPVIFDYSWKEWSGLIEQYYYVRWEKFYAMLENHLNNNTDYSEKGLPLVHGRESFRANDFYSTLADWEIEWVYSQKKFPKREKENSLKIVNELIKKYQTLN